MFFLGGVHIVFLTEYQLYQEAAGLNRGWSGAVVYPLALLFGICPCTRSATRNKLEGDERVNNASLCTLY